MERLFGWFTGSRPEEEEREKDTSSINSRERELRPLTDGEVTTYGSNGNSGKGGGWKVKSGEEDFVIVVSDYKDRQQCSCDVVSHGRLQGQPAVPSSSSAGILKTSHDQLSPAPCPHRRGPVIEWRSRADLPVRMKGLQATLHRGKVCVGGGYTGHAHSEMTVYEYDPNFDLWAELPVSPMRWFGMAEYKGQLVLVGGKDLEAGRGMKMTNRIAVFDDDESRWLHPYQPMSAARSQPVVFGHAHLLVVAGGRKGVLDFNVEVFNGHQWMSAPPLPVPCSPLTSLLHADHWYLLGGRTVSSIYCLALKSYLHPLLQPAELPASQTHLSSGSSSIKWEELAPPPFLVSRIMSLGRYVAVFPPATSEERGGGSGVQLHLSLKEGWVLGGSVPLVCSSSSTLLLPRGELLLLGGDVGGLHYSNKVYRVSLGSASPKRKRAKFASVK